MHKCLSTKIHKYTNTQTYKYQKNKNTQTNKYTWPWWWSWTLAMTHTQQAGATHIPPSDPYHLDKCNTGGGFATKICNTKASQLSTTLNKPCAAKCNEEVLTNLQLKGLQNSAFSFKNYRCHHLFHQGCVKKVHQTPGRSVAIPRKGRLMAYMDNKTGAAPFLGRTQDPAFG